jgi:multiple sugar transport system substrate-binding protein
VRYALALCLACAACAAAADRGADHLTLLHRAGPAAALLEDELLGPFRARHPGMRVVSRPALLPRTEYGPRLFAALSSDVPPDAFLVDDGDVPALVDRGGALDLAPYLVRAGVDPTRYEPAVLAMFRRGPAVYALPRGYTPLVVAYNRDLLERAGIEAPTDDWTWDDFLAIARRLTRDGDADGRVGVWGAGFDRRPAVWLPWIWSGGGDVLCSDGRRASGCLDTPLTIAAIRWYAAWVTGAHVSPRVSAGRDWDAERARLFLSGRLALMTVDHAAIGAFRSAVATGRLHVGIVAIPHRRGVAGATVLYASGYAVPAATLGRKAAVELAAAMTDSLAGAARGEAGIELPAVTSAAQALAAADSLGWETAFLRAARTGRSGWGARVPQWRLVEAELADLMDQVTVGGADAGQAARATARDLDRVLGATR